MDWARIRATLRFDSGGWRRFAELGCVYGPEWWKRGSPPAIAAIIFAIATAQRRAVLSNQRQVRGSRGWLRERWDAYRVFAEFARSLTEGSGVGWVIYSPVVHTLGMDAPSVCLNRKICRLPFESSCLSPSPATLPSADEKH